VVPWLRDAATLVAQTLSTRVSFLQRRRAKRTRDKMVRQLQALKGGITAPDKIVEGLCFGQNRLQALFEINAAAIYTENASIGVGNAPHPEWIETFVKGLLELDQDIFSFGDSAGSLGCLPCDDAVGVLAIVITRSPAVVVLCFRTGFEQELTWGGDLRTPALKAADSDRLTPRKSFAAYKQTIRGRSLPWSADDLEKAAFIPQILRRLLPKEPAAAAAIIFQSIQELSFEAPDSSPLYRSLVDAASDGMALFVLDRAGSKAPVHATQALLNQFNLEDRGPEFSLTMADFFSNIGLPADLLKRLHFGPQEVHVMTGRFANRSYQVELKQVFEAITTDGRVFLSILILHNITKYVRLIETTEAARQEADRANEIKSAFLANVSHEIRTPLNGILGMAHALRVMKMPPDQNQCVEVIERSGEALLQLVNDVLDFSKIEAGKLTLESVSFDLRQLLEDVVRLFRPTARLVWKCHWNCREMFRSI